jgi:hypothetical protein
MYDWYRYSLILGLKTQYLKALRRAIII